MTGTYDPRLIALSVLLTVLTAFAALNLVQRITSLRGAPARGWLCAGALAVGGGIWSAQFFAMLAFSLPVPVVHHLPTMLFSLCMAVLMCFFPLWIASGPLISGMRLAVAGLCMGIGLSAVHYTGLFAMQIVPAVFYDGELFAASIAMAAAACWIAMWLAFALRQGRTLPMLLARAGAGALIGAGISGMFFTGLAAARFDPDTYSLGAAGGEVAATDDGTLLVLAVSAALLLLILATLSCIDHARAPEAPAPRAPAVTGDAEQLEARFVELHEAALSSGHLVAMIAVGFDNPAHGVPERSAPIEQEVARRLAALVRPGDFVARINDDEFVLLLGGLVEGGIVERIAARVREEISREVMVDDTPLLLAPRVGTSLCPADGEDLDTLLRVARVARING
jgi:NO-binding membrane sensor protein with MHYT domain